MRGKTPPLINNWCTWYVNLHAAIQKHPLMFIKRPSGIEHCMMKEDRVLPNPQAGSGDSLSRTLNLKEGIGAPAAPLSRRRVAVVTDVRAVGNPAERLGFLHLS